jgi:predicted esterase
VSTTTAQTVRVSIHGRYLASGDASAPLLVGFHGYAESAETQMERLQGIPGAERRLLVSIQGLHRFYRGRTNEVVAGWMTKQDRDLAIADNLEYVRAVLDAIDGKRPGGRPVFAGFSQGVAMAFRAAAAHGAPAGVIALGGDVPPELDAPALARIPRALVGRGTHDGWYTGAKAAEDLRRLEEAGVAVTAIEFEAGHEWTGAFSAAAGDFLGTR